MKIASTLLCAAGLIAGCSPSAPERKPQVDTAAIVDAIKTDEVHWNADWAARDAAKISAHFAPRAVVMESGAPAISGRAAIAASTEQAMDDPAFALTFASDRVDVAASGDLAAARGTYKLTATDPKTKAVVATTGSYVTVYKPQPGGVWQAVWDITAPGAPLNAGPPKSASSAANAAQ